jgi:hypothetical protein
MLDWIDIGRRVAAKMSKQGHSNVTCWRCIPIYTRVPPFLGCFLGHFGLFCQLLMVLGKEGATVPEAQFALELRGKANCKCFESNA